MQLQLQLQQQEEEQQPQQQICGQLKCPRCSSSNTKFCYYNNYNKSQPRHFCKACKRHWTRGGTLRNVPVGGARKNKHFKTTTSSTTTTTTIAKKRKGNTSCSSSTTTSDNQEQQPWQSNREVPGFPNYVNYNDLNGEDHNMKISLVGGAQNLLLSHLPSTFPFIASSSTTELIGSSTIDHTCLISPFNAQFGQFAPSSSASTTSSDSHNYVSSTAIATTAVDPSSSTITECVDSLSWDYLDTLISTDLKLPWEDYFQTQEPVT